MSKKRKSNEGTNFWVVYSDIAIVLVIIMMLFILAQFVINTKLIADTSLEMLQNQETLRKLLEQEDVVVDKDGNLQLFSFSADVLFEFDKSNWQSVKIPGRDLLKEFGKNLAQYQLLFKRIQIEGHASWEPKKGTNNKRYNDRNWELSVLRALTVGQAFIRSGVSEEKISVAGRSYYVPADRKYSSFGQANYSEGNRKTNRRINVIIFYSQFGKDSRILR